MRKASMVLGIIGGAICILYILFLILIVCFSTLAVPFPTGESAWGGGGMNVDTAGWLTQVIPIIALGILLLVGGLGLAGGIIVKKRNVLGGVFMLVASVFGIVTCVSFILLLLGGIFALVKERPSAELLPPQNV